MIESFPRPEQERLFVASGNIIIPRDMGAVEQVAVPLIERYSHLNNVLEMFDRVVELDRIGRLNPVPKNVDIEYRLTKQQATSRNSAESAMNLQSEARQVFYRAYGLVALQEGDPGQIETEAGRTYDRFTMRFAGKHKFKARQKARELWSDLLNQHMGVGADRPNVQEPVEVPEVEKVPGLSTREKLIILAEAENAGFLPTTNEEKNMVVTYLDYIKSQKFELGTQSQLVEVGNFHGKHHGYAAALEFAKQAGRSIAFEFADWHRQASTQLVDLLDVDRLLSDVDNPNLSLAVALNSEMQRAIPLVRFMDLSQLRASGKVEHEAGDETVSPHFDVLRTRRNKNSEYIVPGMNKVLEDPYTAEERSKVVTKWLKTRMMQIKVGDVRSTIKDAILDQTNRVALHGLILQDLAVEVADSEILQEASKVARTVLRKAS